MKKFLLLIGLLLIPVISFAEFGAQPFGDFQLPTKPNAFGTGSFGDDEWAAFSDSLTFLKQFDNNQGTADADMAAGSRTATFTATRSAAAPATYIDADGVVQVTIASNDPRWTQGYYDATGYTAAPGLLLEGASSNLLKMGIFATDGGGGVATNWVQVDDVTNVATTTLIEEDLTNISNSKAQRIQQTFGDGSQSTLGSDATAVGTFVQNETFTASIWVKGTLTADSIKILVREKDASAVNGTLHTDSDFKASVSSTEWKRFTFSGVIVDADASICNMQVQVSHSGSGAMDLQFAAAQLEQAAYPSSFIPTTTAALTRGAETLQYAIADNFVGGTDGSIALVYRPVMLPDEQASPDTELFTVYIDGQNRWRLRHGSNAEDSVKIVTESENVDRVAGSSGEPFGSLRYSLHSIIGTYSTTAVGGDKLVIYVDGSDDGSSANYEEPVGSLPASFTIQNTAGQAMILTGIALFDKRLSAAEVADVDTLLTR